ncbi:hypothetical protein Tco_0170231 [Tanacetum coccineum]
MNPSAMVWEVEETDFPSIIRRADMKNVAVKDVEKVVQYDIDQNVGGCEGVKSLTLVDIQSMDSHVVEDTTVVDKGTYVDSNNGSEPQTETRKFKFRTLINEERWSCVDLVFLYGLGKGANEKVIDGVFLFKFLSKYGMEQVLGRGPWMIRKSRIILNKRSSSLSLKKGEVTKVPVWVKMHNVQLLAYSEDGPYRCKRGYSKARTMSGTASPMEDHEECFVDIKGVRRKGKRDQI